MASQIMWPQMDTNQPACFQYNRSGSFMANRKYSFVQSDILGFNLVFETIRHLLRYEYHFMFTAALRLSQQYFPFGNIIWNDG